MQTFAPKRKRWSRDRVAGPHEVILSGKPGAIHRHTLHPLPPEGGISDTPIAYAPASTARTCATCCRTDAGEHPPSLVRRATQASSEMALYSVSSNSGESD